MQIAVYLLIGMGGGILAGLFGVGGGLIIVPALVFLMGYSQSAATGSSLVALLAPVGIGGVYAFYQAGRIGIPHIKAGLLISLGMFLGSYLGARFALSFSEVGLKRSFGAFLVIVATKLWASTLH